jgi:heat shock protein HtpX
MVDTTNYNITAGDWRKQIRMNNSRTHRVIFLFILIYLAIGLLVDVYVHLPNNPYFVLNGNSLVLLIKQLITFQIFPTVTVIMGIVAIISIFITYSFYDKIMLLGTDYQEVTEQNATDPLARQLYDVVGEMKIAAGLSFMPKIYIINANYMNAFASGYSERSAMVAITKGLLTKLDRNELEAVMAHELSHVRHQDIKLTLTASILSNLILIVIDMLFYSMIYSDRNRDDNKLAIIIMLARFLLPITTALLMLYLSRTREFMADAGCVELMRDNGPLASALIKIHQDTLANASNYNHAYKATAHEDVRRAAYLYDPAQAGIDRASTINSLFSTHPDLEARLAAIGYKYKLPPSPQ